jgi:hypothetical protein
VVPPEAGEMVSRWLNIEYIETSAKTGENIEKMFTKCVESAIRKEEDRLGRE